jgi:FlaG/FlaF family flagellin (archaellin)
MELKAGGRGVTPAIGVILTVAVVVVLAAVVGATVVAYTGVLQDPAPAVGGAEGDFELGSYDQEVRITLIAGGPIKAKNVEIAVDATDVTDGKCPTQARLSNLPAAGGKFDDVNFDTTGGKKEIFAENYGGVGGAIDGGDTAAPVWEAGEQIMFRIATGDCDLSPGEQLTIRIVHTPTNTVIQKETITA